MQVLTAAEAEVPAESAALEASSLGEQAPMKGAERRKLKADLLAIAAAADAGPEAGSPMEEEQAPLSAKERRRRKAGMPLCLCIQIPCLSKLHASRAVTLAPCPRGSGMRLDIVLLCRRESTRRERRGCAAGIP